MVDVVQNVKYLFFPAESVMRAIITTFSVQTYFYYVVRDLSRRKLLKRNQLIDEKFDESRYSGLA